jgi:catechol 2,3-dioxygenase-like lactoylglutathione lyase family enzyme
MSARRIVPDINIRSADAASGRAFYIDTLGLDLVMDLGWVVTYASPTNRTAQINIAQTAPDGPRADYSVEVADIDAVYERAASLSFPIIYPLTLEPWGVRRFFVRDPHGKVANVMCHAAPVQPGRAQSGEPDDLGSPDRA